MSRFDPHFHIRMLTDVVRMQAYQKAISQLDLENKVVMDIGAGLGVMGFFAALRARKVISLEQNEGTCRHGRRIAQALGIKNLEYFNTSSFKYVSDGEPVDLVVTETMGFLGFEEGLVEICFDLKNRFNVKKFSPYQLRLFAQPLWSEELENQKRHLLNQYEEVFSIYFGSTHIAQIVQRSVFDIPCLNRKLEGISYFGEPQLIQNCVMGENHKAEFNKKISVDQKANAIHFYFEADLAPGVTLSNSFSAQWTHWGHNYILQPQDARTLEVSFSWPKGFQFLWQYG